jgi:hypothetical protein
MTELIRVISCRNRVYDLEAMGLWIYLLLDRHAATTS